MNRLKCAGAVALAVGALMLSQQAALADEAWLKAAGIGPHAPATQDWAAIEKAARAEGTVVLYSNSSRFPKLVDEFKAKYGIEIVGYDMPSDLQIEKFRREHKAGIYKVDVIFNGEAPLLLNEALPSGLVWNFVPDSVTGELADEEQQPLLVHRHTTRGFFYNRALNPDGPPVDNLWDLTREEWRGRVQLASPLKNSIAATIMQTILHHPEEMAQAYEKEFGEAVTYSEAVIEAVEENAGLDAPNAAMEWLYRFLQNEPVFQDSTTKVFKNVADIKQDNPPIGLTTFSKIRLNEEGVYDADLLYEMEPIFGVSYPTCIVIADSAPHPNAAKLLVRYLMEEGFWPWNEPGDYAARSGTESEQVKEFAVPAYNELKVWQIDADEVYNSKYGFLALYLALS